LFGVLTGKELDELPVQIDQFEFPPNYRIYSAGDVNEDVYTIRDGLVKAIARTADGAERIVRLYKPGDVLGLESLLSDGCQHTLMTMATVSVCRIPTRIIKRLLVKSPRLLEQLMRQWQISIERADYWLTHLTTGIIESRVAWLLKMLAELTSGEQPVVIVLPANQEIAAIVDATVESVSRTIANMKREKVLVRVAPHTYQCDLGKYHFDRLQVVD